VVVVMMMMMMVTTTTTIWLCECCHGHVCSFVLQIQPTRCTELDVRTLQKPTTQRMVSNR
jgi:hypothetical protein